MLELLPPVEPGTPETSFDVDGVLEAGTTPNGVFGAKVMWTHRDRLRAPDGRASSCRACVTCRCVRRDKVAQAVSLWTAVQTRAGATRARTARLPEPVYSFAAIGHLANELREQEQAWTAFLDDPLVVVYEELVDDPQARRRRAARDLGIEGDRCPRRGCAGRPTAARASGSSASRSEALTVDGCLSPIARARGRGRHVMREVAAEFERPVLLFSGGKDSIVLLRLAEKAFRPARFPFPILHVDTGHNFPEVLEFRDRRVAELGEELIVASVQESIDDGRAHEDGPSRNRLQTVTLLDALAEHGFDAAFGGARRDEERARAKERILSFRDEHGQWDPRTQRPELWNLFNTVVRRGESVRVFPLSNWTELDVWRYIEAEEPRGPVDLLRPRARGVRARRDAARRLGVPAAGRPRRSSTRVRYRTVGDMTVTGAVRSEATDIDAIVEETPPRA